MENLAGPGKLGPWWGFRRQNQNISNDFKASKWITNDIKKLFLWLKKLCQFKA